MSPGPRPRVAVTFTGAPRDPALWSGTPAGIVRGLEAGGAEVVAVSVLLPGPWHRVARDLLAVSLLVRVAGAPRTRLDRARHAALHHPLMTRLTSIVARRRLRRAGVVGTIQIGTGYRVPGPYVTFEDMTVLQALRNPLTRYGDLPPALARHRVRQQREAWSGARAACFATAWPARSAVEEYALPAGQVRVVGIGANLEARATRRRWAPPTFLFIGRHWEVKGGPALLAAFRAVRAEHPDAALLVVGGVVVDEPGVESLGSFDLDTDAGRSAMQGAWDRATCLVQPSVFEAAGIVFAEAKHAGVPVIGSANGGAADLIGEDGVVVEPGDHRALVRAMLAFADPVTARRVGGTAHRRAASMTWETVAGRLLSALLGARPEHDDEQEEPSP